MVTVSHNATGLALVVTRLKGYFKFDVEVSAEVSDGISGLCQSTVVTAERGSSDLSATLVSLLFIYEPHHEEKNPRAALFCTDTKISLKQL